MVQGTCVTPPVRVKAISETPCFVAAAAVPAVFFCGGCRCGDGGSAALCALCGTRVEEFALSGEVGFPRVAILLHQRLEVGIVAQVVEIRVFVDVVEIGVLSAFQRALQIGECLLLVAAQCVETSRVVGVVLIALGHDGVHACDGRFRVSEEIEGKGRDEVIVGRFFRVLTRGENLHRHALSCPS